MLLTKCELFARYRAGVHQPYNYVLYTLLSKGRPYYTVTLWKMRKMLEAQSQFVELQVESPRPTVNERLVRNFNVRHFSCPFHEERFYDIV